MLTRGEIVAEARSWIGTPFKHQCQLKGAGCDCKGLVVGVGRELGLPEARESEAAKIRNYSHAFRGHLLISKIGTGLVRIPIEQAGLGDVLAILWERDPEPRHLGILTRLDPPWIVHAYGGGVSRVAEVPLGKMRVHSAWTWPSLGEPHG